MLGLLTCRPLPTVAASKWKQPGQFPQANAEKDLMNMRMTATILLSFVAANLLHTLSVTQASDKPVEPIVDPAVLKPTTETFAGEYAVARLQATVAWPQSDGKMGAAAPTTMLLAFRAGRLASFWAVGASAGMDSWRLRGRDTTLSADGLKGRLMVTRALGAGVLEIPIELALTRKAAALTGTIAVAGKDAVPVTGTVEDAANNNRLAPGKDWPAWWGVDTAMRGPTSGLKLVESLTQAKPVWRSEEATLVGFGNGAGLRYPLRVVGQGAGGGASSPVISDGRLFLYYYQPAGPVGGLMDSRSGPFVEATKDMADWQKELFKDMYRVSADDVIIAMDAATGRSLWRTVLPRRAANVQAHKFRGANPTPLVAGNAVYVLTYEGRLYRLDAATGALAWEYPNTPTKPLVVDGKVRGTSVSCASPVLIGQTLGIAMGGQLIAIDAATGKELWRKSASNYGGVRLYAWTLNGKPHFLTSGVMRSADEREKIEHLTLFDPANGKEIWKKPVSFDFSGTAYMLPVLSGDLLFGARFDMANQSNPSNAVVAVRLTATGIEPVWEVSPMMERFDMYQMTERDGFLYVTGFKEVWVIEVKTGKVVAKVPGAGGQATHVLFTAEDRVFIYPEGRHGGTEVIMLSAAGAETQVLSADITIPGGLPGWKGTWVVPHPSTTAYAVQQLIHPIVDGRLFMRGADGIYCYDLRTPTK
jgi:outer membrane protein assembly factor BamB